MRPRDILRIVERAYWRYIARLLRRGRVVPMVSLQDLLPMIREELEAAGYRVENTEQLVEQLFDLLKTAEREELEAKGRYTIHIGLPRFVSPRYPIPIRFYEPATLSPDEIELLGVPREVLEHWKEPTHKLRELVRRLLR